MPESIFVLLATLLPVALLVGVAVGVGMFVYRKLKRGG